MTADHPPGAAEDSMLAVDVQRMHLLSQLYPRYRLHRRYDRHGRNWWWAISRAPIPEDLRAAGLYQSLGRTSLDELQAALSKQDWLLHVRRLRRRSLG